MQQAASDGEYLFRAYHLPLRRGVAGARGAIAALTGTAVGFARNGHTAWACAPRLAAWPHWQPTIDAFARDLARCHWQADRQGMTLATWLSSRYGLEPRSTVALALTSDCAALLDSALLRRVLATGVTAVKVKVGADLDVAALARAIERLRARCGPIDVRLDANGAWVGMSDAALHDRLLALRDAGVGAVEDPVPWARWPTAPPLPLALDLIDGDIETLRDFARSGSVGLAVVKPALCGTVERFLKLAEDLAKANVPLCLSSCFDAPLGIGQLAQLAAVTPGDLRPCGLATHLDLRPQWQPADLAVRGGAWTVGGETACGGVAPPPWRDLLGQAAARAPREVALAWIANGKQRQWTWLRLDRHATAIARRLQLAGLRAADVVALWCANSPELAATLWGIWRAGLVAAPAHPRWTAAEFGRWQAQVKAKLCVVDADHVLQGGVALQQLFDGHLPRAPDTAGERGMAACMALVATSGTTGTPKVIALGESQLAAAAFAWWQRDPARTGDRWLLPLPLCHVAGLVGLWRCAAANVAAVLADGSDTQAIAAALAKARCTLASLVPTQLQRLVAARAEPGPLRLVVLGGASSPPELLAQARSAGWPVVPSYGMTETAAAAVVGDLRDSPAQVGALRLVGTPLPGLELAIGSDDEIVVRGDAVAGSPGTWLGTGDAGAVDDRGRVWVGSRRSDRIVRGGENVDPLEVEAALRSVEGVDDAVVVGINDAQLGECVAAWVVSAVAADALNSRLQAAALQLAPFKRPRRWRQTTAPLPRNAMGKLDLAQVRRAIAADEGATDGVG